MIIPINYFSKIEYQTGTAYATYEMQLCSILILKTVNPIKSLLMFSSKRLLSEISAWNQALKSKGELISRFRASVPNGSTYRPVRTVDHWFYIYDKLTILIDRMNLSEDYFSKILYRSLIKLSHRTVPYLTYRE